MAFCPQCGANVADGTQVCPQCGAQLAVQQPQQPQQPVPPVQQAPQGVPYQQAPMPGPAPVPPTYQPKSKMAAGLLGIFLGGFGVHNFYLGYTGKAVAQLLITLLTCGFGSVISGVWGLIEGIMILTGSINVDGKNVPLKE
ncbi:MAG: TM2 domain-containing protein [Clostridiales bacterium]|nr:TM2 domain-containing protein [Clostridiales bacterium]